MDLRDKSKYVQITVTDTRDYDDPEYHVFAIGGEYRGTFSRKMVIALLVEIGYCKDDYELILNIIHNFHGICVDPKSRQFKGVVIQPPEAEFEHLGLL